MPPIPSGHRRDLTDPSEFEETCVRHGLVTGYYASSESSVPRFRVLVPGVSSDSDVRRIHQLQPLEWWDMVQSVTNDSGEPLLRVVQSDDDDRWISVAWTDAGRAQWAEERRWRDLARRRTGR